jgi:chromosome segregation ATPase
MIYLYRASVVALVGLIVILAWGFLGRRELVRQFRATADSLATERAERAALKAARDSVDATSEAEKRALRAELAGLNEELAGARRVAQRLTVRTEGLLTEVVAFDSTLGARLQAAVAEERAEWQRQEERYQARQEALERLVAIQQAQILARDSTISEQEDMIHAYSVQLEQALDKLSPGFVFDLKGGLPTFLAGAGTMLAVREALGALLGG